MKKRFLAVMLATIMTLSESIGGSTIVLANENATEEVQENVSYEYRMEVHSTTGTYQVLPGADIGLNVSMNVECYTEENGYFQGDTENIQYVWRATDAEQSEFVTIGNDDPEQAIVTIASDETLDGTDIGITVEAYSNEEKVAEQTVYLNVRNAYYKFAETPEQSYWLGVGESMTVAPCILYYCYPSMEAQEVENVQYRWTDLDTSAIQVTDCDGSSLQDGGLGQPPFLLTKLKNMDSWCELVAEIMHEDGSSEEVARQTWDFRWVEYEIWFEGLREESYTWIYADEQAGEEATYSLNTSALGEIPCQVEWQVGLYNEYGEFDTIEANDAAYRTDENNIIVSANGLLDAMQEKLNQNTENVDVQIRAIVQYNDQELASREMTVNVRTSRTEYYYPIEESVQMLPGWWQGFSKNFGGYFENAENPNGAYISFEIQEVQLVNADGTEDVAVLHLWEDGEGWSVEAKQSGHAIATLVYQCVSNEGEEPEEYTYNFDIWVMDEIWYSNVDSGKFSGAWLPGDSVTLTANVWNECYSEEMGHYQKPVDDVRYEWELMNPDYDANLLDGYGVDELDSKVFHLTIKEDETVCGEFIPVRMRAYVEDEEMTSCEYWIYVTERYYEVKLPEFNENEFVVGTEVVVNPQLEYHQYGTGETILTEGIRYRWEWDSNAVEILDQNGNVLSYDNPYGDTSFTLRRLGNWNTYIALIAEVYNENGDCYEVARCSWNLTEVDCSIWFENLRGEYYTWMYTGEAQGEQYTLSLGSSEGLNAKEYQVEWTVGLMGENGEFYHEINADTAMYQTDATTITFDANAMMRYLQQYQGMDFERTDFQIRAIVVCDGVELARTDMSVGITPDIIQYFLPFEDTNTVVASYYEDIADEFYYYVENPEYPNGQQLSGNITDITVENCDASLENEVGTATWLEEEAVWHVAMNRAGDAKVTITYTTTDGTTESYECYVTVLNTGYEVKFTDVANARGILPGETYELSVTLLRFDYNEEEGNLFIEKDPQEELTYEWILENEEYRDIVTMEQDKDNPEILRVTMQDSAEHIGKEIPIRLRVFKDGEEVCYMSDTTFTFFVVEEYYELKPEIPLYYEVALWDTVEVQPELHRYSYQDGAIRDEVVQEVGYRWVELHSDILQVRDTNGTEIKNEEWSEATSFTIQKISRENSWCYLIAFVKNAEGQYEVVTSQRWDFDWSLQCEEGQHTIVVLEAVEATCMNTGLTEGQYCSVCKEVLAAQTEIPLGDHNWKATYTTDENNHWYECECGDQKEAAAHSFEWIVDKEASHKETGLKHEACAECGYMRTANTVIPPAKTVKLSTTSYVYNGKSKKPSVVVKDSKGKTISSKNYTVKYASGRKNVGKYQVTIQFKGEYSGKVTKYFHINPKATALKSAKGAKKSLVLKWTKQTAQVTGYQIQYATDKNFKKGKGTVLVKNYKTASTTLKKLSAKKTYYLRIRTYKTVSGTTYYSEWSKVVKAKTK